MARWEAELIKRVAAEFPYSVYDVTGCLCNVYEKMIAEDGEVDPEAEEKELRKKLNERLMRGY